MPLATLLALTIAPALTPATPPLREEGQKAASASYEPSVVRSRRQGTFHGVPVSYEVVAGETVLKDDEGEDEAAIFSIAYLQEGADAATRPVTFLWNGGPGSSSVWLHLGGFGPMRVVVPSDATDDGGPPYPLVANPGAFLDVSDVVFVDPVGTGFSRALGETEPEGFWGVQGDARSIARFIRRWLADNGRWASPKFIGGESYGTTRSAAVVRELELSADDVALNGVLLISAILDFSLDEPTTGNELAFVAYLPTMATTARFHGLAGQGVPVDAFAEEARRFAGGPYVQALLRGNALAGEERARVRADLARLTGLSEDFVERCDLRVTPERFQKELLRARGLTIGRLDARYTGEDLDDAGETPEADPSFYGIDGAYGTALNAYLGDLGVKMPRDYRIIGGLWGSWDWDLDDGSPFYFNVARYLGTAMRQNKGLHVFVAAGYYDFATPFHGAELSLTRSGVVPERLRFAYYGAGHMMYVNEDELARLQEDVHAFLLDALGR